MDIEITATSKITIIVPVGFTGTIVFKGGDEREFRNGAEVIQATIELPPPPKSWTLAK